ncbi:MAG: hypothetical protein JEZ08_04060 [Clostridiales bacterium]|nr:hypothetical protein [Clostridiales bacterium]
MIIKSLEVYKMIHDHASNNTKGLFTLDHTLFFQFLNTVILLFIFIGIPFIIYRLLKKSSVKRKEIHILNEKIDMINEKLDRL